MKQKLIIELNALNISGAEHKAQQLLDYMDLILERNRQVNLTAITEQDEFIEKHYVDSLAAAALPEFAGAQSVMDLGTGGGFPGVPLAIAFPEKEFVLADSLNKRIRIIQEFCDEVDARNVRAIHGRAEDLGRDEIRGGGDEQLNKVDQASEQNRIWKLQPDRDFPEILQKDHLQNGICELEQHRPCPEAPAGNQFQNVWYGTVGGDAPHAALGQNDSRGAQNQTEHI